MERIKKSKTGGGEKTRRVKGKRREERSGAGVREEKERERGS